MRFIVAKGLLNALISILGASLIIFVISRLSGDPVALMMPVDAPQSAIDALRENLGLDLPIWEQLADKAWSRKPELFDILRDPGEKQDLAAARAAVVRSLLTDLDRWWTP